MPPTLWHIELSHYNEKARWALDYKGIPHVRKAPLPGLHAGYAIAVTRSTHRRLPVLVIDGRRIGDSTAIVAELESYKPDPPLYPADAEVRQRSLDLEDWFDENLGPATRAFNFHHSLDDRDLLTESLETGAPRGRRAQALHKLIPLVRPFIRWDYESDDGDAAAAKLRAAMDRLEAEVGPSGYMAGDEFTIADLTAAALFTPLLMPPERQYAPPRAAPGVLEMREELQEREGGKWVFEMFRRHRGVSAEVAA